MKIKYIVYALIILGFGALIYYRISENKAKKTDAAGGGRGGKKSPMAVNGVVVQP